MTRVLLITDSERVREIFEILEKSGVLQLRYVASLIQSDQEMSAFSPDYTFVQSRISGLSGEIVLRHLKKHLPAGGRLVLLAMDPDDAAQARKQGKPYLDISDDTESLADGIAAVLAGRQPGKKQAPQAAPARKKRAARQEKPAPPTPTPKAERGVAAVAEPVAEPLPAAQPEAEPSSWTTPEREGVPLGGPGTEAKPVAPVAAEEPEQTGGRKEQPPERQTRTAPEVETARRVASFEEAMKQAAGKETAPPRPEPEDRVSLGKVPPPPRREPEEPANRRAAGPAFSAEGMEPLRMREKEKRRWWVIPLVLVLLAPLFVYLVSKKETAPPRGERRVPEHAPAAPQPAPAPAAKPAPVQGTVPAAPTPVPAPPAKPPKPAAPALPSATPPLPAARPAPAPAAPAPAPGAAAGPKAKPAPGPSGNVSGLKALPPFLSGVSMDPIYSKAHPGWERYVGARAEYKLFKKGGLYKAIQVIALPGQTVPDEIFLKVLREAGGIDSYTVQSTESKQHYLVEHCVTRVNVALTIYRKISDRRMKGFVLYYQ